MSHHIHYGVFCINRKLHVLNSVAQKCVYLFLKNYILYIIYISYFISFLFYIYIWFQRMILHLQSLGSSRRNISNKKKKEKYNVRDSTYVAQWCIYLFLKKAVNRFETKLNFSLYNDILRIQRATRRNLLIDRSDNPLLLHLVSRIAQTGDSGGK